MLPDRRTHLIFGIPSLDELIEIPGSDESSPAEVKRGSGEASDATSLSLLGPDGSGKSVLALHLASSYRAWCCANLHRDEVLPKILYVSSDLQYESAATVWRNFGLGYPYTRHVPFERMPNEISRRFDATGKPRVTEVKLKQLLPIEDVNDERSEVDFLLRNERAGARETHVGFLDLAHHTAGDDWNFVNSLIVNLQSCPRPTFGAGRRKQRLSHLIIIDSVAGFETLMGKFDAYGMEQSRRGRIAQSMRNAQEHAHLVFVVEEPMEGERLPEEYVTDIVVRLRTRPDNDPAVPTVEVEKARARSHGRGEHAFAIRNRKGSSTGEWENADAPATDNNYVHVFHSLSHRNLRISSKTGSARTPGKQSVESFGLYYLDRLLERANTAKDESEDKPAWGVRSGTTAALIGDAGTGKTMLGEKFIAEGYRELVEDFLGLYFAASGYSRPKDWVTPARTAFRLAQPIFELDDTVTSYSLSPQDQKKDIWKLFHDKWLEGKAKSDAQMSDEKAIDTTFKGTSLGKAEQRRGVLFARKLGKLRDGGREETPFSRTNRHASFDEFVKSPLKKDKLKQLFRHPNLRFPAVLLTTGDRTSTLLAHLCLGYLRDAIDRVRDAFGLDPADAADGATIRTGLELLLGTIEEQLIVRRFDIDDIDGAVLYDTIEHNIIAAQYIVHGEYFRPDREKRYARAHRIRVVIDDMRVLSNLCPAVSNDSSFLPFLVFNLERDGVTTLLVHTDDLRPGSQPTDPVSKELLSLLKQVIMTWSMPFEGQSRVAVTAIPASSKETNGIVREVETRRIAPPKYYPKNVPPQIPTVDVTRHLELYADLESGKPRLVPLAIYLFGATPACSKYMEAENVLYGLQFKPVPGLTRKGESGRVLWPIDAAEYNAIRDLTHLPWDVKADHTVVDQVDGFWSLDYKAGALVSQREYLLEEVRTEHDDSAGLFRGRPLHGGDTAGKKSYPRNNYFKNSNYESRIYKFKENKEIPGMPDRIPFMWDFGFILVPADLWSHVGQERDHNRRHRDAAKGAQPIPFFQSGVHEPPQWVRDGLTVPQVLEELSRPWSARKIVDWRPFLGACKVVADQARKERGMVPAAFDFAATSAETLLSVVLEIWFSEISLAAEADRKFDKDVWQPWCGRLTATKYEPLPPGSKAAQRFSLARLLCGNEEGQGRLIEDKFYSFRDDYHKAVVEHLKERAQKASPEARPRLIKMKEELEKWTTAFWLSHEKGAPFPERDSQNVELLAEAVQMFESSLAGKSWKPQLEKLPIAALCLYKAWLLLQDVFDFNAALDPSSAFEMKQPKNASNHAMAVRHYYRTACDEQSRRMAAGDSQPWCALAMPGRFSVRGDSFLASAQASRSQLLASNAIDLLCSRRANLTRMQMGLGLPVRDVLKDAQCEQMRTALRTTSHENRALDDLKYSELCNLGGTPPADAPDDHKDKTQWLFRNGMPDYDRVSRAMQKWLTRLFRWTIAYRARHILGWDGGFHGYDALSVHRFGPFVTYTSFDEFARHCDYLIAELEAAERHREGPELFPDEPVSSRV